MLGPMRTLLLLLMMLTSAAAAPACHVRTFETSRFTVCPFDALHQDLRLTRTAARGFMGLPSQGVAFAMNAGMFDAQGSPIGLYIENSKTRRALNTASGDGNFYLLPNGVFSQDTTGALHVETAQAFVLRHAQPRWATQSGPMLLMDGKLHPSVTPDGPSRNIRNGVCVRSPRIAFFAISEDQVSFGRLGRFFRDALGCRDALYLDGVVSSLWWPAAGRLDARVALGPLVVVTNR